MPLRVHELVAESLRGALQRWFTEESTIIYNRASQDRLADLVDEVIDLHQLNARYELIREAGRVVINFEQLDAWAPQLAEGVPAPSEALV